MCGILGTVYGPLYNVIYNLFEMLSLALLAFDDGMDYGLRHRSFSLKLVILALGTRHGFLKCEAYFCRWLQSSACIKAALGEGNVANRASRDV